MNHSQFPHAVVTGGAGFLGSHLVDSLLGDDYMVTSIDNYGSGRNDNLSHISDDNFESISQDVTEPLPEFEHVDELYHFASRASPRDFQSHAVHIALTNGIGTHNIYQTALEHDAKVILASSSEVYGDPEVHPQHETYTGNVDIRGPRAPYDEGKRYAEALGSAYVRQHDLDIRTIRIFNTYGPRMCPEDGRVVTNFLTQALTGEDLTVYGDGEQTRSFCYVSDLIEGVRAVANLPVADGEGVVINLGSDREITIRELATLVQDVIDSNSEIVYCERPEDDPEIRCPDLDRARRLIDWTTNVSLTEGLARTRDYLINLPEVASRDSGHGRRV